MAAANTLRAEPNRASIEAIVQYLIDNPISATSSPGRVFIEKQTASASASIDVTSGIDGTYNTYFWTGSGIRPATDGVYWRIQYSIDGGSTWRSTAGDYYQSGDTQRSGGSQSTNNSQALAEIRPTINVAGWQAGNATTEGGCFELMLSVPANTALYKPFTLFATHATTGGEGYTARLGGLLRNAGAIDALRFIMSSGNIAEGEFTLSALAVA